MHLLSAPHLRFERHLSPLRLAELGRPVGAWRRDDGAYTALTGDLAMEESPTRSFDDLRGLRHRVAIYTGGLATRVAVFDRVRQPINDMAFHPTEPVVLIGCGTYDGGSDFYGQLWWWNWETGAHREVLSELREVTRVRFIDAHTVAVLLRPRYEDEFEARDPFDMFVGGLLHDLGPGAPADPAVFHPDPRIADFAPVAPASLQFDRGVFTPADHRAHWHALVKEEPEVRHGVLDLAWTDDGEILATHFGCHLEQWTVGGERTLQLSGDGYGAQILKHDSLIRVNVIHPGDPGGTTDGSSTLCVLEGERLSAMVRLDPEAQCSIDGAGRVLCRDTGSIDPAHARRDRVFDRHGHELFAEDLGHRGQQPDRVRIDGTPRLYFVRGVSPASTSWSQDPVLCAIEADGTVREGIPWVNMTGPSALSPDGVLLRASMVLTERAQGGGEIEAQLEAIDPVTGERRWRRMTSAIASALTPLPDGAYALFGLTNGRFGLIDVRTGDIVSEEVLRADGVETAVTVFAVQGDRVACGTIDGRVLLFRLVGA